MGDQQGHVIDRGPTPVPDLLTTCRYHLSHPGVLMMEPAEEGDGDN
jgi:hypothetical protein